MLYAYRKDGDELVQLDPSAPTRAADWIDLYCPDDEQVAAIEALGVQVPTLADMEEIEISNRLYRAGETEVLTVMLPGKDEENRRRFSPVAFLLTPSRLVTVRYHGPRSFETLPERAGLTAAGVASPTHLFLALMEEIVARIADLLEGIGYALDGASRALFEGDDDPVTLFEDMLRTLGQRGEELAGYRLCLLTLERALGTFSLGVQKRAAPELGDLVTALTRDIQSLVVHADFLTGRVAHVTDVTLGMVNLEQSDVNRTLSVVAVLFLPPTLVASVYGMNFAVLPGVDHPQGYLIATGLMVGSALCTYLYFRWKDWL